MNGLLCLAHLIVPMAQEGPALDQRRTSESVRLARFPGGQSFLKDRGTGSYLPLLEPCHLVPFHLDGKAITRGRKCLEKKTPSGDASILSKYRMPNSESPAVRTVSVLTSNDSSTCFRILRGMFISRIICEACRTPL